MAQRMESVAPPGGVMLSASTARLVESVALLGDPEIVQIKGTAEGFLRAACWAWAISIARSRAPHRASSVGGGRCRPSRVCWTVPSRATAASSGSWDRQALASPVWCATFRRQPLIVVSSVRRGLRIARKQHPFPHGCPLSARNTGVGDLDGDAARTQVRVGLPAAEPQDSAAAR